MNDNERRAIVWDTIERLAFRPPGNAQKWLGVFAKTLHELWGIEPTWMHFKLDDQVDLPLSPLTCSYHIESMLKYTAEILQKNSVNCYWRTHVDPFYISRGALARANATYPHQQWAQLRGDIEAVLNGMIFHPRCHSHLDDMGLEHIQLDEQKGGLSLHDIRIGGGIENPYVFLFHLRYQFCLVNNDVRQMERLRLIDLFETAIREGEQEVNASDLFDFKR